MPKTRRKERKTDTISQQIILPLSCAQKNITDLHNCDESTVFLHHFHAQKRSNIFFSCLGQRQNNSLRIFENSYIIFCPLVLQVGFELSNLGLVMRLGRVHLLHYHIFFLEAEKKLERLYCNHFQEEAQFLRAKCVTKK